jgi:hypothetical protein
MRHATPDQLKEIFGLFCTYPAIFSHIRQDALSRRIAAGQSIYEDGVAITYQQYKKRTRVSKPTCKDIGILASRDILAIDQASVDMVYAMPQDQRHDMVERIDLHLEPSMKLIPLVLQNACSRIKQTKQRR